MEIKGSAVTQKLKWSWGRVVSGMACLLLMLGWVTVQPAVAGGATKAMKSTIEAFRQAGLRDKVKVLVGDAPITQKYADEIGADATARAPSMPSRKHGGSWASPPEAGPAARHASNP